MGNGQTLYLHTKIDYLVYTGKTGIRLPSFSPPSHPFPPFFRVYHLHVICDMYKPNIAYIIASPAWAHTINPDNGKNPYIPYTHIILLFSHAKPEKGKRNPLSARPRMTI